MVEASVPSQIDCVPLRSPGKAIPNSGGGKKDSQSGTNADQRQGNRATRSRWPPRSRSCGSRSIRSRPSAASGRAAPIANASGTTRASGNRWQCISKGPHRSRLPPQPLPGTHERTLSRVCVRRCGPGARAIKLCPAVPVENSNRQAKTQKLKRLFQNPPKGRVRARGLQDGRPKSAFVGPQPSAGGGLKEPLSPALRQTKDK